MDGLHHFLQSPCHTFFVLASSSASGILIFVFMAKEDLFRTSLVWLAAIMVVVGLYTYSFKKVFVTYVVGILGISGILLPDWDFFNRDFSQWSSPVTSGQRASTTVSRSELRSFTQSPVRVAAYIVVYSFALYKWWMFIST